MTNDIDMIIATLRQLHHVMVGPIEVFDPHGEPIGWIEPALDNSGWVFQTGATMDDSKRSVVEDMRPEPPQPKSIAEPLPEPTHDQKGRL